MRNMMRLSKETRFHDYFAIADYFRLLKPEPGSPSARDNPCVFIAGRAGLGGIRSRD